MIKYSAIIPFHSNPNLLTLCVDSLYAALDPDKSEIIIVNNNAVGSQIDPAWKLEKRCKIVTRKENLMYPKAINLGAEYAEGEYLIFCDADVCVERNFHTALVEALSVDEVGYASAKLLNMGTNNLLEFGITSSYYNFPHPFAGRPKDFELVKSNHYPLAACAACSAIQRDLFYSIGGFDIELVHSYSDIDLCLRLFERGYRTICVANALAYHYGSSTTGSGMGTDLKGDTKGIFMAKHPHIDVQIGQYIDSSCNYLLRQKSIHRKEYFVLDCSTIVNSELYIDRVFRNLNFTEVGHYRLPAPRRDMQLFDLLNFIPYQIRNYRVPIMFFADSYLAFRGNSLWKNCRAEFEDIVLDRHANLEVIQHI